MNTKSLDEVGQALAAGYPSPDKERLTGELARVVEIVLPSLAGRASAALNQGKTELEEVWKAIREDSEELFAPAIKGIERVKVIYVASKFANNKGIGEQVTALAIDLTRSQKEG